MRTCEIYEETVNGPVRSTQQTVNGPVRSTQQTMNRLVRSTQQTMNGPVRSTQQTVNGPVRSTQQTVNGPVRSTQQTADLMTVWDGLTVCDRYMYSQCFQDRLLSHIIFCICSKRFSRIDSN